MPKTKADKSIIGRAELISFADLGADKIPAKADSGAYRSAVHADQVKVSADGKALSFRIFGDHPVCKQFAQVITTSKFSKVWVSNSFGTREQRYEVKLKVKVDGKEFVTDFTLANRLKKVYPILMGRKLLNNRFMVDTAKANVNRLELKRRYKIDLTDDDNEEEGEMS